MDLMPILSTLRRHKTAASLIVVEVALTCAIVCNAVFLIADRIDRIQRPSGLPDDEIVVLRAAGTPPGSDRDELTRRDLAALRAVPGVAAVALVNNVAFGNSSTDSGVNLAPDQPHATLQASHYMATEDWRQVFGATLVAGRDFVPEEYQNRSLTDAQDNPRVPSAVVSRATAAALFPGQPLQAALGKAIYVLGDTPTTIVGIVDGLNPPQPNRGADSLRYAFLLPLRPSYRDGSYMLRTQPGPRERVLRDGVAALEAQARERVVTDRKTLQEMRAAYYQQDRAMAWLLAAVCAGLLVVTALGIVGLASFWVQQRTRMIGTRRALGATRGQIRGYFQAENFLLTTVGIVLGMAGAYGISLALMAQYELPRLPPLYLPLGALVLWALGQIAVLGPARRAAALPPVAAMRGA
ncbi:MAG: FtsX-like permease family protein [Bacteroidia bacterium]|jgi:putative ABC transport system permease protein